MKNIVSIWIFAPLLLSSCPDMAYLEGYNHTGVPIIINAGHDSSELKPQESGRVIFTGDAFQVSSELGAWVYERRVPNRGENGGYFDGTLSVQINRDGSVYLLNLGDEFPIRRSYPQHAGYPLFPR